jgi:hypothetical protein
MQNVPKIVRERLQAATPAVNHPDADALTAFAEHSLPAGERDVVLEHLARCGDCRDVVALALPATEPVQVVVNPSPRGWLTWPALRWAFVAAGIVAIASFGILQYQKSTRPMMMASKSSAPLGAGTEAKKQPLAVPASPPPIETGDKITAPPASFADSGATSLMVMQSPGPSAGRKKTATHAEATGRAGGPGFAGGQRSFGPRLANQFQQQNMAQNQAPVPAPPAAFGKQQAAGRLSANVPAPSTTQAVEVSGAAPVVAQAQNLDSTLVQDQPAARASGENYAYDKIGKAKLPVPPGQIGGYVVDPTGAAVSNARITVIPSKTGAAATTAVTNSQGAWVIAGLPTGNYRVQAEAPGFRTTVLNASYDANQPSMYSFTLNVGSVAETVEVSAQNGQVQTEASNAGGSITNLKVSQTAVNGRNFTQLIARSPLWAITSTGVLRRSVDQGKTWQDVDVNANPASVAMMTLEVAANTNTRAKEKDSNKALKQAATLTFRAVAAAGAEVWAGGSGGALYHSADAGNHWIRVVPASAGTVLTGDITSVEFPDPQHGKLSTSTAEVWTTSDSGQTWQKQ